MQAELAELYEELIHLDEKVADYDKKIQLIAKDNDVCKQLQKIRGIGPLTATALLAAIVDARQFKNGRQLAAWLGLVPKQYSTGGKTRLGGISKRGDRYLRTLMIHGARTTLINAKKRSDYRSEWAQKLKETKGMNKAAIALANRNARVIWALLTRNEAYDEDYISQKAA